MTLPRTIVKVCKPVGKMIFQLKKHSPKILLGLGIAGYAASVYLAGGAGEKARAAQEGYLKDRDRKRFIKGYVKAWGPSLGLFCVSTASVVGGHVILHGRYLAAGAALEATRRAFAEYRSRVEAQEGLEADISYHTGIEAPLSDDPERAETSGMEPADYYTYIFDERNSQFLSGDLHGNLARLRYIKDELNLMLECSIDDRVTLKDALIKTGFKYVLKDKKLARVAGRAGWKHGADGMDNYISFGPMFERILENPSDYLMGRTGPLVIEFNCDGDIYA